MKYIPFTIWLLITAPLCLTIFPAILIYQLTGWFELGEKILNSDKK